MKIIKKLQKKGFEISEDVLREFIKNNMLENEDSGNITKFLKLTRYEKMPIIFSGQECVEFLDDKSFKLRVLNIVEGLYYFLNVFDIKENIEIIKKNEFESKRTFITIPLKKESGERVKYLYGGVSKSKKPVIYMGYAPMPYNDFEIYLSDNIVLKR